LACAVCIALSASGLAQGAARERVKSIGLGLFFEFDGTNHKLHRTLFDKLEAGRQFVAAISDIDTVIKSVGTNSVWFGPRLQFAYAFYGIQSPKHQPVYWEPGVSFPKHDEDLYFNRFLESKYKYLVFMHNDTSLYSDDKIDRLKPLYAIDNHLDALTILERR
jgi:hypothetical protein